MLDDLPREELVQAIDRKVDDLLDAARVAAPPIDAIILARRHLGMEVCLDQSQRQRAVSAGPHL